MPEMDPLTATRFLPPPSRPGLLPRPALVSLLDQAAGLPLTLISAPPGFGKTCLAAAWLAGRPASDACAWLSLHPNDNLSFTFWRYFTAALQQVLPGFGQAVYPLLAASPLPSLETILALLVNDLAGVAQAVILVLDDYHVIQSPEIHSGLNYLLDYAPVNFHLILATREDPPLALARRRARRQVLEIRAADLRFQTEETGRFFEQTAGLTLNPAQLDALERKVEGWAVGLQMAVLSLQDHPDPTAFFQSLAGLDRAVADYLVEEVLQRQSREVREFLLRTSPLEALSPPLCEAVLAGSGFELETEEGSLLSPAAAMLERLERANLFLIPLDPSRRWFRFHPLFAALLGQRLRQLYGEGEVRHIYSQASGWFEEQDDPPGAVSYAFLSGDPERAALLLQRFAPRFFIRSDLPQFLAWVNQVPPALRKRKPGLAMAAAWAALATNHLADAEKLLDEIEKNLPVPASAVLEDPGFEPSLQTSLLEVLVLRLRLESLPGTDRVDLAYLHRLTDALDGLPEEQMGLFTSVGALKPVAEFNLAIQLEAAGDLHSAAPVYRRAADIALRQYNFHILLLSLCHLAGIHLQKGETDLAAQTYEETLARAAELKMGESPFAALAYVGLGHLDYQANRLDNAREKFVCARRLALPWSNWESLIPAVFGLAAVLQAVDDPAGALRLVDETLRLERGSFPEIFAPLEALHALLLAECGQPGAVEEAGRWLSANSPPAPDSDFNRFIPESLLRARLLLLLDRRDEVVQLLQRLVSLADSRELKQAAVETRVLLARTQASRGDIRPAVETLMTALSVDQTAGSIRVFLDGGESIRRLLMVARSSLGVSHPRAERIRGLLTYFVSGEEAFPDESGLVEPLSQRERQVLLLLAEGLSNKDIAARLVVSLATVKTHIANIYMKLDAVSRTQAVARAEALGLLKKQ